MKFRENQKHNLETKLTEFRGNRQKIQIKKDENLNKILKKFG